MSLRDIIDRSPMTRFQISVVALCFVMNIVEGFDILVMSFAASGVAREWHLNGSQIGLLLSSGLIGMALGSAGLAPLADRIGRRPLTLTGLTVAGTGMLFSTLTAGFVQLGLCRLLTGIGVGAVIASLPVIITEYSNKRARGTSIAFFAVGLPVGGVIGGSIAALVTAEFGWRATFALGAVLTILTAAGMAKLLPESLDYLVNRRPAGALERVNALLVRMKQEPLTTLPEPERAAQHQIAASILRGRNGVRTILLWLSFFCLLGGLYFASSWTPRLLEQNGLSAQQGINAGILLNLGGVAGTLLITVLALRFSSHALASVTLVGACAAFILMTFSLGSLSATMIAAILVGLMLNANGAAMYAIAPTIYPAAVRVTAVGWASAAGRLGAIVAPIVAGVLVDAGAGPQALFGFFSIPLLIAAVAIFFVGRLRPAVTESTLERVAVD
jgi:benzoate transport